MAFKRIGDHAAAALFGDRGLDEPRCRLAAVTRQDHRLLDSHKGARQWPHSRQPNGIGVQLLPDAGGHVQARVGGEGVCHLLGLGTSTSFACER